MKAVYLWETKTTSEKITFGSTFWKRTTLDPQISTYVPALIELGYDPRGSVYDALLKPGQKPSKKGESPESYGARCLAAIAKEPSRYYARGIVTRLESDLRKASADAWNTASQMREAKRLRIFPRNPDACIAWSRECDYLDVCAGLADIDDPLLFKHEPANVELDGSDDMTLLSQSAMRSYRSCPQKFEFRYIKRRRTLKKAETLETGSSIHIALDAFRKSEGDLAVALAALVTEDPYKRAKEAAMITGYAAYWGKPVGILAIEKSFRIPLINPETGAASRTWELGGKVDAIVDADAIKELTNPAKATTLEEQLQASIEEDENGEG